MLLLTLLAAGWLLTPSDVDAQSRARVVLDIDDSDGIVAPGDDVDVHIWVRYGSSTKTYELQFFHAVNGPAVIDPGTMRAVQPEEPNLTGTLIYIATARLVLPLGTPHAEATLSARILEDNVPLELGQTTLTIADAGEPVASARISSTFKDCRTSGARSSTSLRRGEKAFLKLEVKNLRGRLTNDTDVKSVILAAAGGELKLCGQTATHEHFLQIADADALTSFELASPERRPIHIDVFAHVIGEDGSLRSNTLVVNFAGQASSLSMGEADGTLAARHGKVRIPVSGLDSDGNRDTLSTSVIQAEVTEGPDDADLSKLRIGKSTCSSSQRDCQRGDVVLLISSPTRDDDEAERGEYTIEVRLTTDPNDTIHTATVQVTGEPVEMTFELLNGADPDVRRIFTATGRANYEFGSGETDQLIVGPAQVIYAAVTLRDENGALISQTSSSVSGDGVRFRIVGNLTVTLFSSREVEVIDGVAYTRFLVASEEGRALIIATSRDFEGLATLVGRGSSRFGADGLIKVEPNNYTTWIATNRIRVSQIYPDLARKGIRTVLLWVSDRRIWQRYTLLGGAPTSDSVDFEISHGDTLWLAD